MRKDYKNLGALRLFLIAALAATYFLVGVPSYIGEDALKSCLTYHFFHASFLHLLTNSFAIWVLFNPRFKHNCRYLLTAYVIAVTAYFIAPTTPVGFSAILYALMGLRTPSLSSGWWRSLNTIIFLIVMVAMLLLPRVAALVHIYSFVTGCLLAIVIRFVSVLNEDYEKAKGRS